MSRLARVAGIFTVIALCFSYVGGTSPAVAQSTLSTPWYTALVADSASQTWSQTPGSRRTGKVGAVVHVAKAPLSIVGKGWTTAQRRAYVASIRADQDRIAAQVRALGGTVRGRFSHLSAGLAVTIDASRLDDLRAVAGVVAVRSVANYQLDLTETVPWIGGTAVQNLGTTGDGVDVAVIDSGIDYTHAKLGGPGTLAAYADAYCGDPGATPDPTDPACTAFSAPDATGNFPNAKVKGGYDWVGEAWPTFGDATSDPNPIDFEGHGTHVADIIAGLESAPGANDKGVAPGANIWSFKACSAVSSSCDGLALLLSVDDAMDLDDSDYGACEPGVDPGCSDYDPADVINMSLGSPYGQPEDDLTLFSNLASYYGSLVVVSAGNSGDIPYIVGSPSTADAAVSVAQSTVPSDKLYRITAGTASAKGMLQPWSPTPTTALAGTLQYGDGAGGNLTGCAAFAPGSLVGKVLLVDRGTCNNSIKGSNGSAAGAAFVLIANNAFSNVPPVFGFGGGTITVPTLTLTQIEGALLKTVLGSTASLDPARIIPLQDDIVASSGRGPRIADNGIKPDIAAPGASVSAEVGSGSEKTAFGGTSGAAPMVSGVAALIVEALEDRGLLDSDPGLDGQISFAPVVKSLLMNTANPTTFIGGSTAAGGSGYLAPITLQGAGRVDALAAYNSQTVAWDITDLDTWLRTGQNNPCSVTPVEDILFLLILGATPPCGADFPFGNDFFNAWNRQTGSLSFGYDGYSAKATETRKVYIANFGTSPRTYSLSSSFRYANDAGKGVTIAASPASVTVPAGGSKIVNVTLSVDPSKLRHYTLNAGSLGASGTDISCADTTGNDCRTLTIFEIDGYLNVTGGGNNTVRLPWHILPKRAADASVTGSTNSRVSLKNDALYKPADTDVFALVDVNPNNCEITDAAGECVTPDYVPGMLPGINQTAIDIKETGLRSYQVPGLNAALGFPAAPSGAINDMVVDFAVSVYDKPYRASHNYPVEFDIYIDSNRDGTDDYVVFNADRTLNAADGRNAVFVADVNPSNGTRPTRPYFYSYTDFNSQNWVLPVPAAAIDVTSSRQFKFLVLAFDAYFTGSLWDCSPYNGGNCGGAYHSFTLGLPKYQPIIGSFQIRTNRSYNLSYTRPSGGASASPSQTGLLFFYRDAPVGRESNAVPLP